MSTREKFETAFKSDARGLSLEKDEHGEYVSLNTYMAEYGFNLGYESRDEEVAKLRSSTNPELVSCYVNLLDQRKFKNAKLAQQLEQEREEIEQLKKRLEAAEAWKHG